MYKIHCMNAIAKLGTDEFDENYTLTDELSEADAILVRSAKLHDLEFPHSLLAIARAGAGVNNIPIEHCAEQGIVVFNTPGANSNAVKEFVVAAMLLASRDIIGGVEWVRENFDDPELAVKAERAKKQFGGTELSGKTMGVIGLGAVGVQVANICRRLGMRVLGYDPYLSVEAAWGLDRHITHVTDINEIYAASDFISIHVPAMPATQHMIDGDAIARMKDGVVFINYARDSLVDESAMAQALDSRHVACYVSDFANTKSAYMKHAIVTPHLGASTIEAEDKCAVMAAHELIDYLENGNIVNAVNFAKVDLGPLAAGTSRLAVFHKNVPSMISKMTAAVADYGLNIENMTNKSHNDIAYTLFEVAGLVPDELVEKISTSDGVIRARAIAEK